MKKPTLITQEDAAGAFHGGIDLLVGRGKRHTTAAVADATGIPQRTIESYCSGDATPQIGNLLSLCAVLGPTFTNSCIGPTGLQIHDVERKDITPQEGLKKAANFVSLLAEILEDGKVDHRERPVLLQGVNDLLEQMSHLRNRLTKEGS